MVAKRHPGFVRVDGFRLSHVHGGGSFLSSSKSTALSPVRYHVWDRLHFGGCRLRRWTDVAVPCITRDSIIGSSFLTFDSIFSTVQESAIPQALLGVDILCQAKSGLGKTAIFVLTTLQLVEPVAGEVSVLVMCHTRELAYQIKNEYARFSKYLPDVNTSVFYGGTPILENAEELKPTNKKFPHIVVATPGRLNALVRDKHLRLGSCKVFVLDECDKMLDQIGKNINIPKSGAETKRIQTCDVTYRKSSVRLQLKSRS